MKDTKKELFMCSIAELKALETHFSDMAEKGWMLESIDPFALHYRRIEPQRRRFFVDILPQITAFDYPQNEDAQQYRRLCEASGWTFVASSKQVQVFYTGRTDDLPVPIHTDSRIEAQIMLKVCRKYELPLALFALVCLWFQWGNVIGSGYGLFLSNLSIAQVLSALVFAPPFLWYAGFLLTWYCRTLLRMKKGMPLPEVHYKWTRGRSIYLCIAGIAALVFNLAALALEVRIGAPVALLLLAVTPLVGVAVGLAVRRQIDTKRRGRAANRTMFVLAIMAAAALSAIGMYYALSRVIARPSGDRLPDGAVALRLTDIGIVSPPEVSRYSSRGSLAVPVNDTYYEINRDGSVRTDMKKVVSSSLAQKIFEHLVKEQTDQQLLAAKMQPDEAAAWGAKEGYYLDQQNTQCLLLYDTAILQLDLHGRDIDIAGAQAKARQMGNL